MCLFGDCLLSTRGFITIFHHYLGNTFDFCPTTQLTQIQVINLFKTLPLLRRVPSFQLIRWIFHVDSHERFSQLIQQDRDISSFALVFFIKNATPQKTNSPVSAPGWCSYYDRVLRWHWFSRGGHDHTTDTNTLESNEAIGVFCYELPKTNGKRPWKMVVGRWIFFLGSRPIFEGELFSFKEGNTTMGPANPDYHQSDLSGLFRGVQIYHVLQLGKLPLTIGKKLKNPLLVH